MKALGFMLFAASLALTAVAQAAPVPGTSCNVLPADNIWNTDISTLPVHPRSAPTAATCGRRVTRPAAP